MLPELPLDRATLAQRHFFSNGYSCFFLKTAKSTFSSFQMDPDGNTAAVGRCCTSDGFSIFFFTETKKKLKTSMMRQDEEK